MTTKEQIYKLLDSFTDEQLEQVLIILNSIKKIADIESEDDAFCQKMIDDYLNDSDLEKNNSVPLDEFVKELGFNPKEFKTIDWYYLKRIVI